MEHELSARVLAKLQVGKHRVGAPLPSAFPAAHQNARHALRLEDNRHVALHVRALARRKNLYRLHEVDALRRIPVVELGILGIRLYRVLSERGRSCRHCGK